MLNLQTRNISTTSDIIWLEKIYGKYNELSRPENESLNPNIDYVILNNKKADNLEYIHNFEKIIDITTDNIHTGKVTDNVENGSILSFEEKNHFLMKVKMKAKMNLQ